MQKCLVWKGLVIVIIVLFVGLGVIPSTGSIIEKKTTFPNSNSGGYIQNLIDNANPGDTINIPSGIYYENIIINKSISLIGEHRDDTIIDGGGNGSVVRISADKATVSGFTIQKGGETGIYITSNRNIIKGNTIELNNKSGICLYASDYNIVAGNTINLNNETGINIWGYRGFMRPGEEPNWNFVLVNNITNNKNGIYLHIAHYNFILKNNFIDNEQNASFRSSHFNRWKKNYWNQPMNIPKIIYGDIEIGQGSFYKWIDFDLRPANRPYDI